jgi:uncharacterized protein with NRDE domain
VHAISNHLMDEPWPKVVAARLGMDQALEERDPSEALFAMLSDGSLPSDEDLPDTGVGVAWERRLGSALITGEDYGTRASTVLTLSDKGAISFEERTRGAMGEVTGTARERFVVEVATA